jgi:hypothetical protein
MSTSTTTSSTTTSSTTTSTGSSTTTARGDLDGGEQASGLAQIAVQPDGGNDDATIFGIVTQADVIDVDAEIAGINGVLGRPTGDTGWLPMPTEQLPCKRDAQHREVVWNDLRLSFERGFEGANLGAWNLGPATVLAPNNPFPLRGESNLTTQAGVGLGSARSELAVYEATLDNADSFIVRSGPFSYVSFDLVDDRVVSISSGPLDCLDPDEPR